MPRTAKAGLLPWLALTSISLVSLPALYMGAYYAMLADKDYLMLGPYDKVPHDVMRPCYHIHNSFTKQFFLPANKIDRTIRPEYWSR